MAKTKPKPGKELARVNALATTICFQLQQTANQPGDTPIPSKALWQALERFGRNIEKNADEAKTLMDFLHHKACMIEAQADQLLAEVHYLEQGVDSILRQVIAQMKEKKLETIAGKNWELKITHEEPLLQVFDLPLMRTHAPKYIHPNFQPVIDSEKLTTDLKAGAQVPGVLLKESIMLTSHPVKVKKTEKTA